MDYKKICETNPTNERIFVLDVIRIVAIFLVIWIHSQEQINFDGPLSYFTYLLGRAGVPLFLMISGALFFLKEINIKNFIIKKALYLYIIAVFWFFIYGKLNHLATFENLYYSFMLIPVEKHLWYLSMLPFLYLILPLLSGVKKISTKSLLFLISGLFIYKWLNLFLHFGHPVDDYFVYIAYVLFGYVAFHRALHKKIPLKFIVLSLFITTLFFIIIFPHKFFEKIFIGHDKWWYYSPFIVAFSAQIYLLLLKLFDTQVLQPHVRKFVYTLSENCFGIYIIHYYILLKINYLIHNTFLLFILTFIVSFIAVYLFTKIPITRFLFYKKAEPHYKKH